MALYVNFIVTDNNQINIHNFVNDTYENIEKTLKFFQVHVLNIIEELLFQT